MIWHEDVRADAAWLIRLPPFGPPIMALAYRLDSPHAHSEILQPLLRQHRDWWSRSVAVECREDRIRLSGTVTSYHHKQLAQEAMRQALPSLQVHNELQVLPLAGR